MNQRFLHSILVAKIKEHITQTGESLTSFARNNKINHSILKQVIEGTYSVGLLKADRIIDYINNYGKELPLKELDHE
jgi:hypothetical protein